VSNLIKLTNHLTALSAEAHLTLATTYRARSELLRMPTPIPPGFTEECMARLHIHIPSTAGTRLLEIMWLWFVF